MQTVGIIGGSGFIGSYVTKLFLEEKFKVKASVTDITRQDKYDHLLAFTNAPENLEIVGVDVRDMAALESFVQGCDVIVHGGTPFILDIKDPQRDLFEPTVNGTNNFLEVISKLTDVKKVVLIASVAAYNTSFPLNPPGYETTHVFSENQEPYMGEADHPYSQAKFMADQAVRKFVDENNELPFTITSVSPTFVIGNALSTRGDSTSQGMQYLFKNKIAPNPFVEMMFTNDVFFSMVDVRDVAEAVYQAATRNGLHGKNYLIANESYRISDVTRMLNNEEPANNPEYFYSHTNAKQDLGLAFISAKDSLSRYA